MKNRIVTLTLAVAAFGITTSSCTFADTKKSKIEIAKEKVVLSTQELNQQIKDSIQLFRTDSEKRIANYEKKMADLKLATKKKSNSEYEKIIADIEQKNKELRKKLDDSNQVNASNWNAFKTEFNNDMKNMEEAFKNLTVDNVN